MAAQEKRPNRLLRGFIVVSLMIHTLVFFHIAGIYKSQAVSYIELTMHQLADPNVRHLPKPRFIRKPPMVSEASPLQEKSADIPDIKLDPVEDYKTDRTYERISLPKPPDQMDIAGLSVSDLSPQGPAASLHPQTEKIEFTSAGEYFEMLNLRIDRHKRYPERAKSRRIEGRVKVEFALSANGTLSNVKVIQSSRNQNLDAAAVEAVQNAAPFPRPPSFLFKAPVKLRISILFELS